jgi:hypothetical protein
MCRADSPYTVGLNSIASRLHTLEQIVQRSNGPLVPHALPALSVSATPEKSSSAAANAPAAQPAPSHSTILSKLSELTTSFHSLAAQDAQLQAYLASYPSLQSLLASHPSTSLVPSLPSSLTTRSEEVVLSAAEMFQRTADMLERTKQLSEVVERKWPLEDFTQMNARVATVEAALPSLAFAAAQQHVHFSAFLRSYGALIDLCNRQFVQWMTELERVEREVDEKLAQQGRK